jgi:peptidoglycan/LPS O-acetylase OafA/YrhL
VIARLRRLPRPSLAVLACGVLALAVVLTPWFALDEYQPNGWDASWWPRAAALLAVLAIVALRAHRDRIALALIGGALVCIVVRAIAPPDFGFAFDGLDVPTERLFGLWLALGAGIVALVATALGTRGTSRSGPPEG